MTGAYLHPSEPAGRILRTYFEHDRRIVAAWQYGSSLRTDFAPGRSDIDILVAVTDTVSATDFREISDAVRRFITTAETTLLRVWEVGARIHPGWSSHYFNNVAKSGVHLYGPDLLSNASAPTFEEALRRLVQLCQRVRLVIANPTKEHEADFWLTKYQHWIPLSLMEFLDLHGVPEYRLHEAHATFSSRFPDAAPPVQYPYASLSEVHAFLEGLLPWLARNWSLFTDREHPKILVAVSGHML